MLRNEVFIEERIPARITEEHTIVNDFLKLKHEALDNKEIKPTEEIPERITEEQMNMNEGLTRIS